MLILTLVTMGVGTMLIGLLPTYKTIGVAAPILDHGGFLDLRDHDFRPELCRDERESSARTCARCNCRGGRSRVDYDPILRRAL
jgi:hypothetical protein